MCEFPSCTEPVHSRGLCSGHYRQWHQGRELAPLRFRQSPTRVRELTPEIVRLWQEGFSTGQIGQTVSLKGNVVRSALVRAGVEVYRRKPRDTRHGSFYQWRTGCDCPQCSTARLAFHQVKYEKRQAVMSDEEKAAGVQTGRIGWQRRQGGSVLGATRRGYEWTDLEVELCARDDLSIEQVASMVNRTYAAVANVRTALSNPNNPGHARFRQLLDVAAQHSNA